MAYKDPEAARAAIRAHYYKNKEVYLERNRRVRRDNRVAINTAKAIPCADCGISYPSYVMDLDHRPGEAKLFEVGTFQRRGKSRPAVAAEIAKCDVVCSNCHRERTHRRLGG